MVVVVVRGGIVFRRYKRAKTVNAVPGSLGAMSNLRTSKRVLQAVKPCVGFGFAATKKNSIFFIRATQIRGN
jgi:hypothetical protein